MSEQHIPGCTLAFKLVHVSSSVIIVGGLWAAPMSGQPTFDSQGPRKSVKTLTTISFTSWIPASSQLFGLAGIQYEKKTSKQMASLAFRFYKIQAYDAPQAA